MKRLPVVLTGVVALLACLLVILFEPEFLVSISRQGFDVFLRASAKPPQSDAVVLLDIDEESLSRYGQWPWPRRLLGRMVQEIPHDRQPGGRPGRGRLGRLEETERPAGRQGAARR